MDVDFVPPWQINKCQTQPNGLFQVVILAVCTYLHGMKAHDLDSEYTDKTKQGQYAPVICRV